VKSIAADYGMRLAHHALIIRVTGSLATLAAQDDPDAEAVLSIGLDSARSLHQHFYENDLPPGQVRYSAARVAEAIDLMQQRFGAAGNGFV
jgi:uroporphyrinogen-III synthase